MSVNVTLLEEGIWAVAPEGRVDVVSARSLEDALNGLFNQGHIRIVVDLSAVSYMASGGLRVLFMALRRAKTMSGDLRLAAMDDRVRDIFRIAGFEQLFTIHPSTAEALQKMKAA